MASTRLRAIFSRVDAEEVPWAGGSLRVGELDRLDRFTLGVIAAVFLLLLINIGHLRPSMSDTWYHDSIAQQFRNNGNITGWDQWDYAPIGRPQLYPPLLHILIATLSVFVGGIIHASQLCAVTFLPLALLTTWYAARRILDSRAAFVAVLIVLTDLMHLIIMEAHIAGCLVNILMPVLMVTFLARRPWWSILVLTLMLYAHLGLPICAVAGLLLFGLKYRGYGRLALKVTGISLLFFTPWLSHVLANLDWLPVLTQGGIPGSHLQKLLSLQSFNVVLLGLGFWGLAIAPRNRPERMLPAYLLIGFLPILFAYGGRYVMHTMPLWGILGGSVILTKVSAAMPLRQILGLILLTFVPWPTVAMMSGLHVMPMTAPDMIVMMTAQGQSVFGNGEKSEAYRPDCDQLAKWIDSHTTPDEVVYTNSTWMADMISLLARRRTSDGAWWEDSKKEAEIDDESLRDWLPHAVFACIRPAADTGSIIADTVPMPGVDHTEDIGRFRVGVREPHWLALSGSAVTGWRLLTIAGTAGSLMPDGKGVRWFFPASRAHLSAILAAAPKGSFAGAKLSLISSDMANDLVFGLRTPDGHDYHWPLAIPRPWQENNVRVIFDWMVDARGNRWPGGKISQVYFACPAAKVALPSKRQRSLEVMKVELVQGGLKH